MELNQNNIYGNNNVTIGTQPRLFNEASKQQLKGMINKNDNILIMAVMNDSEASSFAETVKSHLVSQGYKVEEITYATWPFPVTGLHVNEIDANGKRGIIIGHNA